MIRAVLERGNTAELTDHLGYERGDPAGRGSRNSRSGSTPKTVGTEVGDIRLDSPRDRKGSYPVIYLDALVVKVRDGAHVSNRAAHIAVGVDMDGVKHVLGIWVQASEGAKFWAGVCAQLANRGVKDVLIVCCDGLTGFPEAIEQAWPRAMVQTCVVHGGS